MVESLLKNGFWHLIAQSDWVSKSILLVLLGMSIVCWTVFFYKLILLRIKKRQVATVTDYLAKARTVEDVRAIAFRWKDTITGYLMHKNMQLFHDALTQKNSTKIERMLAAMDASVETMVFQQGSYLSILSTSAAVAPLLGLLGTVWGLIHAFIGMSEQQGADIAAVAPGIAEALITTLGGLLVAIPAVAFFNYLATQTNRLEDQLLSFADLYRFAIEQAISL